MVVKKLCFICLCSGSAKCKFQHIDLQVKLVSQVGEFYLPNIQQGLHGPGSSGMAQCKSNDWID